MAEEPIVTNPAEPVIPPAKPAEPTVPPSPVDKLGVPPSPGAIDETGAKPPVPPNMVPITALHEERDKRQSLQAEIEVLKRVAGQNVLYDATGAPVAQSPQVAPPQNDYAKQLDELWESDPRKAVQAELMAAINWYDKVNSDIDFQEGQLADKYADFNTYRTEVRRYVRTLPPEQRTKPGIVELAYYAIRGQKVDGIISKTKADIEAEMMRKYQAGELAAGLPPGGVSAPPAVPGAVALTPDQKNACLALGITEADYVKNMAGAK